MLDEPLSALDAKVRKTLRTEICEVQQSLGIPTIMVTHDQEEAMTMADRIVCMKDGKIEQVGTPSELYNQPKTSFVASFLGSMNVLNPFLEKEGENKLQLTIVKDNDCSIGIRPESIKIVDESRKNDINTYHGTASKIENLGSVSLIQADVGGESILIERRGFTNFKAGDELWVQFPVETILSFSRSAQ